MQNEYWIDKWKNKDIKFTQEKPNLFLLKYIDALELKEGARIFVPLCGKSIDMLWLLENGYQVVGVELSSKACLQFFNENQMIYHQKNTGKFKIFHAENISLLSGDFFDLKNEILGKIDAIYDRAALIALAKECHCQYAKKIIELSDEFTKMLLLTISYNHNELQGPPFSVDTPEVSQIYAKHFEVTELYNEPADLPQHLCAKGLKAAQELVFKLIHRK